MDEDELSQKKNEMFIDMSHLENHKMFLDHISTIKVLEEVHVNMGLYFILENYSAVLNFIKSSVNINNKYDKYIVKLNKIKNEFEILRELKEKEL